MADETPGFVSLDQHLANRAGLSTGPESAWQRYVGGPTGRAMQMGLAPLQTLATGGGLADVMPAIKGAAAGEPSSLAKGLNPWQTPTQAGIMLGTAGAGGLAGALAPEAGQLMQGATRVMGAATGGGVGGAIEGGPRGMTIGTAIGAATGALGEGLGATANYLRQMGVDRAKRIVQEQDAARMGEAIERIPKMKGVFGGMRDAAGLEDLAKGYVQRGDKVVNKGIARLQDYMDQQDTVIQAAIQQQKTQYGRNYQFPDAMKPGEFTTYENARKSLSELGQKAFGGVKGQPLEPTIAGVDSKQLYAETTRLLQKQLASVDPKALQAFNDAQGVYEAGRYLLKDVLRPAFRIKGTERVAFNSNVVQSKLADSRVKAAQKLGIEGFEAIAPAVRLTPERMGQADVYQPTGLASQIAGVAPLPGAAYARVHVGKPQLVGNPLNLADASRTGISLGTNQMLAPIAQSLAEQTQGIPGLGR